MKKIWKCKEKQIEYGKHTLTMGIVNITPDSFSDGGEHIENAVDYALSLINDGADIIDLGAQSTRPGADIISPEEEWSRLESVLAELRAKTDKPISVDTFYPYVAKKALDFGADIINDVSAVISEDMLSLVREYGCGYVITHNGNNCSADIKDFFSKAYKACVDSEINTSQLCFDVGIGFGKSFDENMKILANINDFRLPDSPLLLGVSRKSVIGKATNQSEPARRIYGNIAADTLAILGGVDIIRLHDIKNEKQGIIMAEKLKEYING